MTAVNAAAAAAASVVYGTLSSCSSLALPTATLWALISRKAGAWPEGVGDDPAAVGCSPAGGATVGGPPEPPPGPHAVSATRTMADNARAGASRRLRVICTG